MNPFVIGNAPSPNVQSQNASWFVKIQLVNLKSKTAVIAKMDKMEVILHFSSKKPNKIHLAVIVSDLKIHNHYIN